jgi:hypothetical protein
MDRSKTSQQYLDMIRQQEADKKKASKYKNVWVTATRYDDNGKPYTVKYQSKKEKLYEDELIYRKQAGEVIEYKRQVEYKLVVNGLHICTYRADFVVLDRWGNTRVIDTKSPITRDLPQYVYKKKLLKALHNIDIVEIL